MLVHTCINRDTHAKAEYSWRNGIGEEEGSAAADGDSARGIAKCMLSSVSMRTSAPPVLTKETEMAGTLIFITNTRTPAAQHRGLVELGQTELGFTAVQGNA